MFCPQCGAEIASDRIRFCTHCRFPIGSMKEFIVTEAAKIEAEEGKKIYPPRQRDITLGAGLMLVVVFKVFLLVVSLGGNNTGEKVSIYLFLLSLLVQRISAFLTTFSQTTWVDHRGNAYVHRLRAVYSYWNNG